MDWDGPGIGSVKQKNRFVSMRSVIQFWNRKYFKVKNKFDVILPRINVGLCWDVDATGW